MADNITNPYSPSAGFFRVLVEMGFPRESVEKAVVATKGQGLNAAMDWLLATQEAESAVSENVCSSEQPASDPDFQAESSSTSSTLTEEPEISVPLKSMRCDECKKLYQTEVEIEQHVVATGHALFTQEESKPLTEEQKKDEVKRLEALIKQRRAEKAEQEQKDEIEREKSRRKHGQELTEARQKLEELEMKRLAEIRKQEKLEARQARQRVLEDIERDKQARRERYGQSPVVSTSSTAASKPIEPKRDYDKCRIQIRLSNGESLVHTFSANEELAAVRLYVEMNRSDGSDPFSLMTSFPKKVFTEEDMCFPLKSLGLVPSAVLILKPH